jgi:hypothetical protein
MTSRALVPYRPSSPARGGRTAPLDRNGDESAFDLVSEDTALQDRAQVERFLPDILGRALARAWLDPTFRAALIRDPVATLAAHRIRLPASIRIDVVTEGQTRPMVVVSEVIAGTARRLLYLQLVMVAGR